MCSHGLPYGGGARQQAHVWDVEVACSKSKVDLCFKAKVAARLSVHLRRIQRQGSGVRWTVQAMLGKQCVYAFEMRGDGAADARTTKSDMDERGAHDLVECLRRSALILEAVDELRLPKVLRLMCVTSRDEMVTRHLELVQR